MPDEPETTHPGPVHVTVGVEVDDRESKPNPTLSIGTFVAVAASVRLRLLTCVGSDVLNDRLRPAVTVCELKFAATVAEFSVPRLPERSIGEVAVSKL